MGLKITLLGLALLALGGCGALLSGTLERRAEAATRAFPPQGRILDVGGVPVHAVVKGRGPDVVVLHGANGNTRDFSFGFVDELAKRYRVIVFDRPGFGHTGRIKSAYRKPFGRAAETLAEQAALLSGAAAQLGAHKPVVVGHSYGGSVALAWALAHPSAAIVPISAPSNTWTGGLGPLYALTSSSLGGATAVPVLAASLSERYVADLIERIFAPDLAPEGYAKKIGAPLSIRADTIRANARQLAQLKEELRAMIPQYGTLTLPVEIVHGTADTIVPLDIHALPLSQQLPNARLTILDDIGHMPHHAALSAVAGAVDRAVARAGLR